MLCGPSGQALRFDPIPVYTNHIKKTEQITERVPRERIKNKSKADRKKFARKIKRALKKSGKVIKIQQNKVGVYIALELIGYILFSVIALWLILSFYAAITGSFVWYILLAFALGLLSTAIWASIKRKELILMNPNLIQQKRIERSQKFKNDVDRETYIKKIKSRRNRYIFLGLWLVTLLAVMICLAVGFSIFFQL